MMTWHPEPRQRTPTREALAPTGSVVTDTASRATLPFKATAYTTVANSQSCIFPNLSPLPSGYRLPKVHLPFVISYLVSSTEPNP